MEVRGQSQPQTKSPVKMAEIQYFAEYKRTFPQGLWVIRGLNLCPSTYIISTRPNNEIQETETIEKHLVEEANDAGRRQLNVSILNKCLKSQKNLT